MKTLLKMRFSYFAAWAFIFAASSLLLSSSAHAQGGPPPKNQPPIAIINYSASLANPLEFHFDSSASTDDVGITSRRFQIENTWYNADQLTHTFSSLSKHRVKLEVVDGQNRRATADVEIDLTDLSHLVADEALRPYESFAASLATTTTHIIPLQLRPGPVRINLKNADGEAHAQQNCASLEGLEYLGCEAQNLIDQAYVDTFRVDSANIFLNGKKVFGPLTDAQHLLSGPIALTGSDTLEIRIEGPVTSYLQLELQSLEVNLAPQASFIVTPPPKGVPALVLIDASASADPNDQVTAFRAEIQPDNIVTDFQASPHFALSVPTAGTKLVTITVRDKFGLTASLTQDLTILENLPPTLLARWGQTTSQAPFQVQLRAEGSDPDDPTSSLLYNFIFPDQTSSGFTLSPTTTKVFPTAGTYYVIVQVKDPGGLTAEVNLPITVQNNLLPVAQFNIQPRNDFAPATLSFDASPSFDPDGQAETSALQFRWDFGDGESAEGKSLQHTFLDPGEYAVRLFATDPRGGMGILGRIVFAWSSAPPTPRLSVSPNIGPIPLQVTFNASASTPGDTPIARYVILTGDGTTLESTSPILQHTYTSPNIFSATLKVYDQDGDGNLIAQSIRAFNGQKPIAFVEKLAEDVIIPASFTLTAANSTSPNPNAQITQFNWTLPNGETRTGPTISFTTNIDGIQYVRLQVTDNYGIQSDPVNFPIAAALGIPPVAIIQSPTNRFRVGQVASFSGTSSWTPNGTAQIVEHKWFLPSGEIAFGPQINVPLNTAGNFAIGLEVTDSKGYKSARAEFPIIVEAIQPPTAVIQYALNSSYAPTTLMLDGRGSFTPNLDSNISAYEWRVDGPNGISIPAFGPDPQMQLHVAGDYTINLRVFDSAGGTSPWVSVGGVEVRENQLPQAQIQALALSGVIGEPMSFDALASLDPDGHTLTQYSWSTSDGQSASGVLANFTFQAAGIQTVQLIVTDELGASSAPATLQVLVFPHHPPVVSIIAERQVPSRTQYKLTAQIESSAFPIVEYEWTKPNGEIVIAPELFENLSDGENLFQLRVRDAGGMWSAITTKTISVPINQPPVARISYSFDPTNSLLARLSAQGSTDDFTSNLHFTWQIEGSSTDKNGAQVQNEFAGTGIFLIRLTARDSEGLASSTEVSLNIEDRRQFQLTSIIRAGEASANSFFGYTAKPHNASGVPLRYRFNGAASTTSFGTHPLKHRWDFGDGAIGYGEEVFHTFRRTGRFVVQHRVENQMGESATSTTQVDIMPIHCLNQSEGSNACFNVQSGFVDPVNFVIDRLATDLQLGHDNTDFDTTNATISLIAEQNDGHRVELSESAQLNGNVISIPIHALMSQIDETQSFSLEVTITRPLSENPTEEEVESNVISGVIPELRIAIGTLSLTLPANTDFLSLTGAGYTLGLENPGQQVQIPHLPAGDFEIKAFRGNDVFDYLVRVSNSDQISLDLNPSVETQSQKASQRITKTGGSKQSSAQAQSTSVLPPRVFPALSNYPSRLPGFFEQLLRVNGAPEVPTKSLGTFSKSTRMQSTSGTPVVYESFCGESAPQFRIVEQSISALPNDGSQYSRVQTNAPDLESDPNASVFSPVREVTKTNEVEISCGINGASMAHQFNKWVFDANKRCCAQQNVNDPGGLAICNSTISADYMNSISTYYQDEFPVDYYVAFRDKVSGRVEVKKHSFTLTKAARVNGLNRDMMADLFGLPATTRTPGWYIPYSFNVKVPEGMTEPEFSVRALSSLPTSGNNYFCWVKGNPGLTASTILMAESDDSTPAVEPLPIPIQVAGAASMNKVGYFKSVFGLQASTSNSPAPSPTPALSPAPIYASIDRLYDPAATGRRIAESKLFPLETMETIDPDYRAMQSGLKGNSNITGWNQVSSADGVKPVTDTDRPWEVSFRVETKIKNLPINTTINSIKAKPVITYIPISGGATVTASNADPITVNLNGGDCVAQTATSKLCRFILRFHWQDLKLNQNSNFTTARANLNIDQLILKAEVNEIVTPAGNLTPQIDSTLFQATDGSPTVATLNGQYNVGARSASIADENSTPQTSASNWNYRCPEGYSGAWVGYGKVRLARFTRDYLRAMNRSTRSIVVDPASGVTNDFAIACNDGSMPFGGGLFAPQGSTLATGICEAYQEGTYCRAKIFSHAPNGGHAKGTAIDARYFYTDRVLRDRMDPNAYHRKRIALQKLLDYTNAIRDRDLRCPPTNFNTSDDVCFYNGFRRFTGRECFINREQITIHRNSIITSPTWLLDPEVEDEALRQAFIPSIELYEKCPNESTFRYGAANTFDGIEDSLAYQESSIRGFQRIHNAGLHRIYISTDKESFGVQIGHEIHARILTGHLLRLTNQQLFDPSLSYPTFRNQNQVQFSDSFGMDANSTAEFFSLSPSSIVRSEAGHADHLHLQVP